MPSKKPIIATRTDQITIKKFEKIAEKDNRSMSNLSELLIKKHIQQYESEHGEIIIDPTTE